MRGILSIPRTTKDTPLVSSKVGYEKKQNILSTCHQKSFCRKRVLSACYDILITCRLQRGQLLNWVMACVLWNAWSKGSIYQHALGWMKQTPTAPCSFSCYNNSRLVLGPSERKKKKKKIQYVPRHCLGSRPADCIGCHQIGSHTVTHVVFHWSCELCPVGVYCMC